MLHEENADVSPAAVSPEDAAGPLSQNLYLWAWSFFRTAHREIECTGTLSLESLPPVSHRDSPDDVLKDFGRLLAEEYEVKRPSLTRALWRLHGKHCLRQVLVMLVYVLCSIASAGLLRPLVLAVQGQIEVTAGYAAVVGVAATSALSLMVQQRAWRNFDRMSRHIWLSLVAMLARKPAQLNSSTFGESFTQAEVLSMIGQDAPVFPYQFPFMFMFIASPLLVLSGSAVLFVLFRQAYIPGFIVCVVFTFASEKAAGRCDRAMADKFKCADERTLVLEQAMHGMHHVKLCNWEVALERRVTAVRAKEMKALWRVHRWYALQMGMAALIPVLATVSTFLTHAALDREFESSSVLMALGCFEIMATAFLALPTDLMYLKTFILALGRMERLILKPNDYTHGAQAGQQGLSIENGSFGWDTSQAPSVSRMNLKVQPGELVAVVGRVASGKTTLAAAACGLCHKMGGRVCMDGRLAYVPQHPQTLNATLRENILFGETFNMDLYKEALKACHMVKDLKQLANADQTEIGEKGITLSGGQRARIGLARAVYSRPDVAILDDPLSAMDAHVAHEVFNECIVGSLRDKGCAVLFITNQPHFCQACDRILVMDHGQVVEEGTYEELQQAGKVFTEMISSTAASVQASEHARQSALEFEVDLEDLLTTVNSGRDSSTRPSRRTSFKEKGSAVSNMNKRRSLNRGLSSISDMEEHETTKQLEKAMKGRIDVREFMRISQTGNSKLLGAALFSLSVSVPILIFATSLSLVLYTSKAKANEEHSTELLLYLLTGGLYTVCIAGRTIVSCFFFGTVSERLHSRMVGALLRQCMSWYDTTPVGRIMNRCSQDVAALDLMVPRFFEWYLQHTSAVIVGFLGAAALVWPSLFVMLPILWFVWKVHMRYGGIALNLHRLMLQHSSHMMAKVDNFFSALDTIRAFRKEEPFEAECQSSMSDVCRVFYWTHSLDRMVMTVVVLFSVPALILLVGIGTLVLSDFDLVDKQLGALGVALCCGITLRVPLLMWTSGSVEKFMGGAQCVREYAELEFEGDEQDQEAWRRPLTPGTPRPDEEWPLQGSLVFDCVDARYDPGLPLVLNGFSLTVKPGERLGVCGRTGSGKSTLFLASFRMLRPEDGCVILDGKDSREVPLRTWRKRLGIVPQDPLVFSGTVRSNLDIHGKYSDKDLWTVLHESCLEEQVKKLEHGLDEPVHEMGTNFSAGTVQLLSIARIFLGKEQVSVLFLDECTSNMDFETDNLVQRQVKKVFEGKSVVCIAHRIQTVLDYDRIACLQAGSVVEEGTPKELLEKRHGYFAEVAQESGHILPPKKLEL